MLQAVPERFILGQHKQGRVKGGNYHHLLLRLMAVVIMVIITVLALSRAHMLVCFRRCFRHMTDDADDEDVDANMQASDKHNRRLKKRKLARGSHIRRPLNHPSCHAMQLIENMTSLRTTFGKPASTKLRQTCQGSKLAVPGEKDQVIWHSVLRRKQK